MKQKIKNIFSVSSKKALGKLGLFLIFGMMIWNLNGSLVLENEFIFDNENYLIVANAETWVDEVTTTMTASGTNQSLLDKAGSVVSYIAGKTPLALAFKAILIGVLSILHVLTLAAAGLVDLALNQKFIHLFLTDNRIYIGWVVVRDMLNMFFMLLLLFSAFATIFQVEKYHLRKMIIMLIVMALLVNFSYPITIFIIDFSNSAMFYLVDQTALSQSAKIANFSGFSTSIYDSVGVWGSDFVDIILSIILIFILFVTLFAVGLNLLIRILAFAVLIVVSPAGFVFAFFPDTKNIANDWWGAIFKYAFMGPVMVFFIYLANLIFNTGPENNDDLIVSLVRYIMPMAFLWMGLIAANKFGGSAAGAAMNIAKRGRQLFTRLSWAGTKLLGRGLDNVTGGHVGGTWGAVRNRWNQFGDDYKRKVDRRSAELGGNIGVRDAREKLVRERLKVMEDEGISNEELNRLQTEGTMAEQMAVALFRAKNNRFDNDPAIAQAQYNNAMNAVRGHQVYENQFLGNARKTNMDLVINERITQSGANTPAAIQTIVRDELGRLDPDQWRDQNIVRMVANTTPNRGTIIAEGANVISRYSQQGQDNVTRNMRGAKLDAGRHINNGGAGLWA